MDLLIIPIWLILGFFGVILMEKAFKESVPTVFCVFGPFVIGASLLIAFFVLLDDSYKKPSKLRKWFRGF